MKRSRVMKPVPILAGLLTGLLLATFSFALDTKPAPQSHPGQGLGPSYDAAHEVTVNGTVQEVVTKHALGSPAGLHLLISGSEGTIDAHVGSFLAKDTQEALHAGLPIQIVGAMLTLHGKQFLLARQLIFGGRTVTVRSKSGALAHESIRRPARPAAPKVSQVELNGGVR